MALQVIDRGTTSGDHTGETGFAAMGKIINNFAELYGTYLAAVMAAASFNDYTPSSFAATTKRLDITPNAGGSTVTGLVAGFDGQTVLITNISASDSLTLTGESSSSAAANRFRSSADLVLPPGGRTHAVYFGGSINRWSIG